MGLQDWFVDSAPPAAGSVSQALEGRHCYRSMSPHKEGFTNKFEVTYPDLFSNLSDFEQRPSSNTLEHVTYMKEYKELVTAVLSTTGTRSQIVVNYLKDESAMLAILSTAETGTITQHLQAERQILKLIFAFDRIT